MVDLITGAVLFGGGVVVGALWQRAQKTQDSAWRPPAPQTPTDPLAGPSAPLGGALPPDIQDLARRGRKIEAIKLYRERTGVGLKEALDAIERGM